MSSKSSGARKRPPPPPPAPPADGKTEVLLRFFESEHFDEWVAISNLWRTNNDGVVDYLCNRLLSLSDERVERYLNQIITLQILRPNKSLERAIVRACARSIRLGTQTCWLLAAAAGDSKKPGPIMALRDACEQAALAGEWRPPFAAMSPMLDQPLRMDDVAGRASARLSGMARVRAASADAADAFSEEPESPSRALAAGVAQVSFSGREESRTPDTLDDTEPETTSSQRVDTFASTLKLAEDLCGLSTKLSAVFPPEGRHRQLRAGIESVSDALIEGHAPGAGVMFPMGETHARVVRIPASEAVLLNSREKAPYLLCLEVIAAPGEEWSHDESPVSRRTRSTPRHSRESSDSLPLHDMSTPLWSTHDFLAGANGSGGHDPAEMRTSSSAASTFSSANSGPLHPGLNAFAGGLAPRRDGGRGLTRNGSSFSSLSDAHDSIDEDAATAPHEGAEAPRRTSQTSSTLNPNWKPPLSPASTTATASPTAAVAAARGAGIFSGGAAGVKPSHFRTKSFESISKKVDVALAQVWRGDEPIVRASIALASGRNSAASSLSGKSDDDPRDDARAVRVTLFVENPAPPKGAPGQPKLGGHHRTPSDVGLAEMATRVNLPGGRSSWAPPAGARDATAPPVAAPSSPPRPRSAAGPGEKHAVPSPWKRSAGGLGERWEDKVERVRASSPYGNLPGWALKPVIIKAGDNCRQELLALQMTRAFAKIYADSGLPLWLRPFDVIATSTTTAFIEAVTDAPSIHAVKSRAPRDTSLRAHFEAKFGKGGTPGFRTAQRNFVESLAGYSVLTYILQVKDRHNGNILLHDDGHLIHIDFNFMLSTSPGGINFESAPFKLTREYLEVMDSDDTGMASEAFNYYKVLCIQGYLAVRKHAERIISLVEMMSASGCPCFKAGPKVLSNLRRRFNLGNTEEQCVEIMLSMVSDSMDAWCTRQYDFYQRVLNGIL